MLQLRAGPAALEHIRLNGLKPGDVGLIPGAAGGAKWLVLKEFDRYLFERWLADRVEPLDLVGSSIGAWRFAAGMLGRTERFFELYLGQRYSARPDRAEITAAAREIMRELLGRDGAALVLAHRRMRLAIMTARGRGPLASERKALLAPGLAVTAMLNLLRPRWQQLTFRRHLFADPRVEPRWAARPGWRLDTSVLTPDNLGPALLASGSIPMVLEGVRNVPGAPPGVYRDGGVTDYHMPLDYPKARGIVLFPHFSATFKAGWFDKHLKWRRLSPALLDNVLLVHPSADFIASLPHAKIPDRHDFMNFSDAERLAYWRRVVAESRRLVDAWDDWLTKGCPLDGVRALTG